MIAPPTNSASANSKPISSHSTMPSSTTRLVLAIMNTIAAVKSAPRANNVLARAEDAYEQDELMTPKKDDFARVRGRWLPRAACISVRDTNAWTAPDNAKPRTSAQRVSQNMKNASSRPCQAPCRIVIASGAP